MDVDTSPMPTEVMNKSPKTDKLISAIKKARLNGEIISPSDPDFKKKIRKYLLDDSLSYA